MRRLQTPAATTAPLAVPSSIRGSTPALTPAILENSSGTDVFERGPRKSLRGGRRAKLHLRNQRFNAAAILQEMSLTLMQALL